MEIGGRILRYRGSIEKILFFFYSMTGWKVLGALRILGSSTFSVNRDTCILAPLSGDLSASLLCKNKVYENSWLFEWGCSVYERNFRGSSGFAILICGNNPWEMNNKGAIPNIVTSKADQTLTQLGWSLVESFLFKRNSMAHHFVMW